VPKAVVGPRYAIRCVRHFLCLSFIVWTRIWPILRDVIHRVRDERLEMEKRDRRSKREEMVAAEYLSTVLRRVAPSAVSFMPSLGKLIKMGHIAQAIEADLEPSEGLLAPIEIALHLTLPTIEEWIRDRAEDLRLATPIGWTRAILPESTPETAALTEVQPLFDIYDSIASHDLAVYVYRCDDHDEASSFDHYIHGSAILVGLDAVAHQCKSTRLKVTPMLRGYQTAMEILEMVGKDPARTSPAEMDAMKRYFTCIDCGILDRKAMTWRGAV
jgi:hypothetical protein